MAVISTKLRYLDKPEKNTVYMHVAYVGYICKKTGKKIRNYNYSSETSLLIYAV